MSIPPLSRRDVARLALAATASAFVINNAPTAQAAEAAPHAPTEGDALLLAVPLHAGYALSDTQTQEAALALKDYPGAFAKARALSLPNNLEPAFAPLAPAQTRKGRAR